MHAMVTFHSVTFPDMRHNDESAEEVAIVLNIM